MNIWVTFGVPGVIGVAIALILFGQARTARLPALFLLFVGIICLGVPLFPGFLEAFLPNKIRLFMGVVSMVHLFITLEALRRNQLKERYALLWLGTGIALLGLAIQPDLIGWLVVVTGGMHYTSAIMLVVFAFVVVIAFHVSLVLSKQETERRRLAQEIALMQKRIEELESK